MSGRSSSLREVAVRRASVLLSAALAVAALTAVAGCGGDASRPSAGAYTPTPDGSGTLRRTIECLQKDSEGNCVATKCTKSPSSDATPFDCGSYAKECIKGGDHWTGTRDQGVCAQAL